MDIFVFVCELKLRVDVLIVCRRPRYTCKHPNTGYKRYFSFLSFLAYFVELKLEDLVILVI